MSEPTELPDRVIRKGRKRVAQGPPDTILWHYVFRWDEGHPELDIIFEYDGMEYVFTERGKFWIGMWRDELYYAIEDLKKESMENWVRESVFSSGRWVRRYQAREARKTRKSRLECVNLTFLTTEGCAVAGVSFSKSRADCVSFLREMRKVIRKVRREAGVMVGEDVEES